MSPIFGVLSIICGLASLACAIVVVFAMFKAGHIWQSIVGIATFGLFAFIWGWIKAKELGVQKVMLFWTIFVALAAVFSFASATTANKPPRLDASTGALLPIA